MEQPSELLQRFARGDLDAFESLFRQFQGEVFRWIVRIVRDGGIAEDLTIETFWPGAPCLAVFARHGH